MIVVGFDLSHTRAGVVGLHWNESKFVELVFSKVISLGGMKSVKVYGRALDALWASTVKVSGKEIDSAVIERIPQGELMGCARGVLEKRNIPYILISSTQTKKLVGGSGKASKADIAKVVRERFGIEFPGDEGLGSDLYDAAGHALVGLNKKGMPL